MFNFSQIPVVFNATPSVSHCAAVCVQTTLRPAGPATDRHVDARKLATCAFSFAAAAAATFRLLLKPLMLPFSELLIFLTIFFSIHSEFSQSFAGSSRRVQSRDTSVCVLYAAVLATMLLIFSYSSSAASSCPCTVQIA